MTPSPYDEQQLLARVLDRLDINGLRELQLELWISFADRGLGGSYEECRAMANAAVEHGLRYFADRVTRYVDLPGNRDPRRTLEHVREVMASRAG